MMSSLMDFFRTARADVAISYISCLTKLIFDNLQRRSWDILKDVGRNQSRFSKCSDEAWPIRVPLLLGNVALVRIVVDQLALVLSGGRHDLDLLVDLPGPDRVPSFSSTSSIEMPNRLSFSFR